MSSDEIEILFVGACNNYEKFLENIGGQDVGEAE